MENVIMNLLLVKFFVSSIAASQCRVDARVESSLTIQKYFIKVSGHDDALPKEDIISTHTFNSKVECSLKCLLTSTCVSYNYWPDSDKFAVNCQLSDKIRKRDKETNIKGKWKFYKDLKTVNKEDEFPNDCKKSLALGMESNEIRDGQVTASSHWRISHGAANARLNFVSGPRRTGAWSAKTNDLNQWLQVDFKRSTIIEGISTQGRQDRDQFVKSYTTSFSEDGKNFYCYVTEGILKVFQGNNDRNTTVHHKFAPAIKAQYIRVHPTAWREHISMRVEFYGCFD